MGNSDPGPIIRTTKTAYRPPTTSRLTNQLYENSVSTDVPGWFFLFRTTRISYLLNFESLRAQNQKSLLKCALIDHLSDTSALYLRSQKPKIVLHLSGVGQNCTAFVQFSSIMAGKIVLPHRFGHGVGWGLWWKLRKSMSSLLICIGGESVWMSISRPEWASKGAHATTSGRDGDLRGRGDHGQSAHGVCACENIKSSSIIARKRLILCYIR